MIRACRLVCSSLAVLALSLAPAPVLAATPACGHANLANPGHHYGLIKNGCLNTPPPSPLPAPRPVPAPTPNPVSGVVPPIVHAVVPVVPHFNTPTEVVPDDAAPAPLVLTTPPAASVLIKAGVPSTDSNPWVVIGLLASSLLLLLLIALAVSGYLRRRHQRANAPAH